MYSYLKVLFSVILIFIISIAARIFVGDIYDFNSLLPKLIPHLVSSFLIVWIYIISNHFIKRYRNRNNLESSDSSVSSSSDSVSVPFADDSLFQENVQSNSEHVFRRHTVREANEVLSNRSMGSEYSDSIGSEYSDSSLSSDSSDSSDDISAINDINNDSDLIIGIKNMIPSNEVIINSRIDRNVGRERINLLLNTDDTVEESEEEKLKKGLEKLRNPER